MPESNPATPRSRLLLVEDVASQARMVQGMLGTGGLDLEVVHVGSLVEAKRFLTDSRVACTLLDLTLPDAKGLEGLVELRNLVPDVPVVVVTADEDEARAVKAVQAGAQDYLIKGHMDSEQLCRSVRYAIERARSELALAHLALHDALTGLPNRTLFMDRLALELAQTERHEWSAAVLFLDVDGFKEVNDRFGHLAGDQMLRGVAGRLLAWVRPGDTVSRFGGDEFTILCPEISDEQDAITIAERVLTALKEPFHVLNDDIALRFSMGITLARGVGKPEAVLEEADRAMYVAKRRRDADYALTGAG